MGLRFAQAMQRRDCITARTKAVGTELRHRGKQEAPRWAFA